MRTRQLERDANRLPSSDPVAVARQEPRLPSPGSDAVEPARFRRRPAARIVAAFAALAGASAVLEWLGWRIVWRHHHGTSALDGAWAIQFLQGAARTFGGAIGVGATLAAVTWLMSRTSSQEPGQRRRRAGRAFVTGAAGMVALLTALTLWAP